MIVSANDGRVKKKMSTYERMPDEREPCCESTRDCQLECSRRWRRGGLKRSAARLKDGRMVWAQVPAEDARWKGMREGGAMRWRHDDSPGNFVSQEGREARKAFSIVSSFR